MGEFSEWEGQQNFRDMTTQLQDIAPLHDLVSHQFSHNSISESQCVYYVSMSSGICKLKTIAKFEQQLSSALAHTSSCAQVMRYGGQGHKVGVRQAKPEVGKR